MSFCTISALVCDSQVPHVYITSIQLFPLPPPPLIPGPEYLGLSWLVYVIVCIDSTFSDIEYSDETMQNAIVLANQLSSFLSDADAYVKGQLQCQPIEEALLMER